jgi:hypothetical protein
VHHGVVANAEDYRWCSGSWFVRTATPAFKATVESLKIDRFHVADDFDSQTFASVDLESGVKPPHSKQFLQPMIQGQPNP